MQPTTRLFKLPAKKNILFIINPTAGIKTKNNIPQLIEKHLNKDKFIPKIKLTQHVGHAMELSHEAVDNGTDMVVAVGGDGTINETATPLVNSNLILGIIPTGSGNGLARHLNLPTNLAQAIEVINNQNVTAIDTASANDRMFFCTAGIGFDSLIGRGFAATQKRGFGGYVNLVIKEFLLFKPLHFKIVADGNAWEKKAFVITVANAGQYGNNAWISPHADIADGKLDLCIISPFPKILAPQLVYQLFNRTMDRNKYMKIQKVESVEIESPDFDYVHLDGESLRIKNKLKIEINPSSLRVLVPETQEITN